MRCRLMLLLIVVMGIVYGDVFGLEVVREVEAKVRAQGLSREKTVRTALVYEGRLAPSVIAEEYFDALVPFDDLLKE